MSQYPPPPSFRGPFNPNPQLTPSSSAAHHAMPQFSYNPFRDPNNQNLPSAQFAHPYSYNTTSHNANASLAVPGTHQAPYVGFGQTSNGSFLPPPWPPSPYGIFSQPPSSAHHREPSLGSIQPHNSLPLKPPPVAGMTGDPNSEKAQAVTANISELEDGELSDGELDRDQRQLVLGVPKTSRHSAKRDNESPSKGVNNNGERSGKATNILKADHEKDNRGDKTNYSPHGNNPVHSLNNLTNQVQKPSHPQELAHTVPPLSSIDNFPTYQTEQCHGNSTDSRSSSQSMRNLAATSTSMPRNTPSTREAIDPTDVSRNDSPQENVALHRKWQDLHDRAKDALKQLYADGIGFAQIANEGIDTAVLRNLYTELGIPVPLMTQANQFETYRTTVGSATIPLEITEPLGCAVKNILQNEGEDNGIDSPKTSTQSAQNLEMFKDSPNTSSSKGVASQTPVLLKENVSKIGNKTTGWNTSARDAYTPSLQSSNLLSKPAQTTKASKLVTNNLLGKPTASKIGDKALERKDYIARMLAAKAGKSIPTANSAVSPGASINRPKETTSKTPLVGENQLDELQQRSVYVNNISYTTTEGDIKTLFSGFEIESVSTGETLRTNKSTGSSVVVLSSATEAQRAISELSGKYILDRKVSIQTTRKTGGTAHVVEDAIQVEDQSASETVSGSMSKSEMYAKANKMAQTELARQKIEALNLKNRVNIPPPTVAPRSNVQGSLSIQEQQKSAEESQSKLVQLEPLITSRPTVISQTQGPFFMPANRKPAFVIPGLFMDSALLEPSTLPEQSKIQPYTMDLQDKREVNLTAEVESSELESPMTHSQIPAVVNPRATSVLATYAEAQKQPSAVMGMTNESRKRQKATDFIDSPSVRVRRPLGQNEDTSVIIEISEDETNGDTEDENMDIDDDIAMDIDEDNGQHTPPKQRSSIESTSGKSKGIRDLPPLSDFSGRKKISSNTAVVTPPAAQTPSKSREPESLKIKEKEIELMNRRIAELEQRIKAKQTASRAHTPSTPGSPVASPKLTGVSAGSHEKPRSGVVDKETNHAVNDRPEDINLKETAETAEAAGVVETAEISATTNAVTAIKAAEITKASEAAEAADIAEIAKVAEAVRLAELAKAAEAAEAVKMAELARAAEAAEAVKAIEEVRLLAEQQTKTLQLAKADAERLRAAEVAVVEEEKQRLARRAEIESGLPILDAEVERTKRKLELLKKEMSDLSREVQRGIEGRRILMEELNGLTPPPKPPRISQERIHINGSGTHAQEPMEERYELSSFGHRIDVAEQQQNVQGRPNGNDNGPHSPVSPVPVDYSQDIANDQRAIDENQDVMDTSPDGLDEPEVIDYSPESPTNVLFTPGSVDAEEVYEPPVTVDTISIPPTFSRNEDPGQEIHIAETAIFQTDPNSPPGDIDGRRSSQGSKVISNSSNDVHAQYEPPASIRSTNLADASDSDDYEPPEPSPPVENTMLSPINAASDIVSSHHDPAVGFGPPSHSMPADSIAIINEQMKADDIESIDTDTKSAYCGVPTARVAKFTPYESPLKQFKSYRYHPDYLSEVPLGFRSLTYSHGIDPAKPVCQFEAAGGVCNDNSCDGQHFRSMSLSDDMVLVEMGAIPEGLTPQERDAYANGLRQIIQEIRGRKVRDFNAVAAEITAYRSKFLGDDLKVLPL